MVRFHSTAPVKTEGYSISCNPLFVFVCGYDLAVGGGSAFDNEEEFVMVEKNSNRGI